MRRPYGKVAIAMEMLNRLIYNQGGEETR